MRFLVSAAAFAFLVCACSPAATTTSASSTTSASTSSAASSDAAIAEITALYQPYLKHGGEPPAWYQALPMTPELAALVARDQQQAQGEVGAIDGDPIIDAQDWQLSDLAVAADAPPANGHLVVTAHFKNLDQTTDVHFDMVERASDHTWLVDNVRSANTDLRALLNPPAPKGQ